MADPLGRFRTGITRREFAVEEVAETVAGGAAGLVEVEVHGESFRQDTLEALAGPKDPDGKHVLEGVTLRCEPRNPTTETLCGSR